MRAYWEMAAAIVIVGVGGAHAADRPPRFWNLTAHTIVDFRLSPAGQDKFGVNQCANDKDGEVDNDERLRITGIAPGIYDAKLREERDLVECDR
jgi:hypothetical protein